MKPNNFSGNRVFNKDGEPFDKMLRRFKRKIDDSGLLDTLRANEFYEKPTTERKRKAGAAKARWRKKLRDKELPKKLF